ncbi:MAG: GxxExxY protein [Saprospiraceae bacterium]
MNQLELTAKEVVDSAYTVHKELGQRLLESAYQFCLENELRFRGLNVEKEKPLPLKYREQFLDCGYRVDLLVEGKIILELKSVEALLPIHTAQILTYLRLSNLHLGFLINFNTQLFKNGIKHIVFNLEE